MLSRMLVFMAVAAVTTPAYGEFVLPTVDLRVTTEIHGLPPMGAAHVENKVFHGAPLDGSVIALFDENIEVDDPPLSNLVQVVTTVTSLGPGGQHIEISFFGPNAMDGLPGDDEPIFVDLYGTYTDSDIPITGPVDLFDVAGALAWEGYDASDLLLDEASVTALIVNVDGTTVPLGIDDHPLSISYFDQSGEDWERIRIGLYSSTLPFAEPWVPELVDLADEVHLSFNVYVPGPAPLFVVGSGVLAGCLRPTRRRADRTIAVENNERRDRRGASGHHSMRRSRQRWASSGLDQAS